MSRLIRLVVTAVAASTLILTGCNTASQTNKVVAPNASPGNSTPPGNNVDVSNTTGPANTVPSNAASPSTGNTTNGEGPGNSSGSSGVTSSPVSLVEESVQLAKQGLAINVPYAVQQNIAVVQSAWGKPDSQNSAGAGIYVTYGRENAAFGLNKGDQIFDVRSYSSVLHTITLSDIESVLGAPADVRETSDSVIYMYPAGVDYQLLFVFQKTSSGSRSNTVDHVSVFWPQGTVNSMAATQPAPSVVVDNAPGRVGSLFTFSIMNPPKGYRLVELEWIPNSGTPVINTFSQAFHNGQTGGNPPIFNISGDGSTYSFIYPQSLANQTGVVRVIFQATSGAAMIGNSPSITLK